MCIRDSPNGRHPSSGTTAKKTAGIVFSTIFKIIGSILLIMFFTGIIVGSSVLINIFKMADNTVDVDLHTLKLDLTSFIYVNDENGNPVEYQSVYAGESRIWVDYDNIPEAMKNAIIAIEDKRFYDHKGCLLYTSSSLPPQSRRPRPGRTLSIKRSKRLW